MKQVMYSLNEVSALIEGGAKLLIAGDEQVLTKLPKGDWIAGTIPYFMAEEGGRFSQDQVYATALPDYISRIQTRFYTAETIQAVYDDAPEHGFSVVIIPASSATHLKFALDAPHFNNFATRPLIGWISGVFLDDLGKNTPKVCAGDDGQLKEDGAIVMHISLPADKVADIGIVNIFEQSEGDRLEFPQSGFSTKEVLVNGAPRYFADYCLEKKLDTRFPLVADYFGSMVNISFQCIDETEKEVHFYAPVFSGVEYRHASGVGDYLGAFDRQMPREQVDQVFFSCNCILNYLYSELEGKKTAGVTGPITFGEIAYQLLNQTMAYLSIYDIEPA